MWKVILRVWKKYKQTSIWKKRAEDADQTIFGKNRQPSTCAFHLFLFLVVVYLSLNSFLSLIRELTVDGGPLPICV